MDIPFVIRGAVHIHDWIVDPLDLGGLYSDGNIHRHYRYTETHRSNIKIRNPYTDWYTFSLYAPSAMHESCLAINRDWQTKRVIFIITMMIKLTDIAYISNR